MSSSGTRKNSPSQIVTGANRPASPRVQPRPRPFSSSTLRALYLSEAALVVAGRLSQILYDLQPVVHLGRQRVTGKLRERLVEHRNRGLVRRVVVGIVRERCADLGIEDVVYELVGVVRMRRPRRYSHVVRPAGRPRLGNDVIEVRVLGEGHERIP